MATTFEQVGPRVPVVESIRVDKVGPRARLAGRARAILATLMAFISLIPVLWIILTAFKPTTDVTAIPPKLFFTPSLQGFVSLLTDSRLLSEAETAALLAQAQNMNWIEQIALQSGRQINGPSQYAGQLLNSLIIA